MLHVSQHVRLVLVGRDLGQLLGNHQLPFPGHEPGALAGVELRGEEAAVGLDEEAFAGLVALAGGLPAGHGGGCEDVASERDGKGAASVVLTRPGWGARLKECVRGGAGLTAVELQRGEN